MNLRSLAVASCLAIAPLGVSSVASVVSAADLVPDQTTTMTFPRHACAVEPAHVCWEVVTMTVSSHVQYQANALDRTAWAASYVDWSLRFDEWSPNGWLYEADESGRSGYDGYSHPWTIYFNQGCTAFEAIGWHCDWGGQTAHGYYWRSDINAEEWWDNQQTHYDCPWGGVCETDMTYLRVRITPSGSVSKWSGH